MKKNILSFFFVLCAMLSLRYVKIEESVEPTVLVLNQEEEKRFYLDFQKENLRIDQLPSIEKEYHVEIKYLFLRNQTLLDDEKMQKELENIYYVNPESVKKKYELILTKYGLYDAIDQISVYQVLVDGMIIDGNKKDIKRLQTAYRNMEQKSRSYELSK